MFFFFKQKTAYEMRIRDWSSDVCASDLGQTDDKAGGLAIHVDKPDKLLMQQRAQRLGEVIGLRFTQRHKAPVSGPRVVEDIGDGIHFGAQTLQVDMTQGDIGGQRDRKSTRLNSSH